jgi:hypothetical protein
MEHLFDDHMRRRAGRLSGRELYLARGIFIRSSFDEVLIVIWAKIIRIAPY